VKIWNNSGFHRLSR